MSRAGLYERCGEHDGCAQFLGIVTRHTILPGIFLPSHVPVVLFSAVLRPGEWLMPVNWLTGGV